MLKTVIERRKKAWQILTKELGAAEATLFLLDISEGEGDYSKIRKELFKNLSIEEVKKFREEKKHK